MSMTASSSFSEREGMKRRVPASSTVASPAKLAMVTMFAVVVASSVNCTGRPWSEPPSGGGARTPPGSGSVLPSGART